MKIFYINLDNRTDRKLHIENELKKVGLEAERIPAVTPSDLADLLPAQSEEDLKISKLEMACSMSHRKAWEEIISRNLEYALILEDDVVLSSFLPSFLDLVPKINAGVDIIRVETRFQRVRMCSIDFNVKSKISLYRPFSELWGAAGYIIKKECAERLLSEPDFFALALDHLLFFPKSHMYKTIRCLQCNPGLVMPLDLLHNDHDKEIVKSDIAFGRDMRAPASAEKMHGLKKISREFKRVCDQIAMLTERLINQHRGGKFWAKIYFKR